MGVRACSDFPIIEESTERFNIDGQVVCPFYFI